MMADIDVMVSEAGPRDGLQNTKGFTCVYRRFRLFWRLSK